MTEHNRVPNMMVLRERLRAWSSATGSPSTPAIVGDLSELWAAASALTLRIEELANADEARTARLLVEIDTWLYAELLDHANHLRAPLSRVIREVYRDADPPSSP